MLKKDKPLKIPKRPKRAELSREDVLRRMASFPLRKAKIIAAIGKVKD